MLRLCTMLLLTMRASGDATSEAEAQALVKLTHLFKRDPAAAEQLGLANHPRPIALYAGGRRLRDDADLRRALGGEPLGVFEDAGALDALVSDVDRARCFLGCRRAPGA